MEGVSKMKKRIFGFVCVFLIITCAYGLATNDALITEGYLNDVFFPKVKEYIEQHSGSSEPVGVETFTVVEIKEGQKFYGKSGCEFILRQGAGTVIASALGGLNDVTGGEDLKDGQNVPPNHLLIVPRDDSRGFLATKNVLIMVKGEYVIK